MKGHFFSLFLFKAGLLFLFQMMCHVYLFTFPHLSKVLYFNLLERHLIKISLAVGLC